MSGYLPTEKEEEDYVISKKIKQYEHVETLLDCLGVPKEVFDEQLSLSARVEVALNLVNSGVITDTQFSWPYNHLESELV